MAETPSRGSDSKVRTARPHSVPERRAERRYPARSIGFRSAQIQANLVDVSRDGLAIESLENAPIGTTLAFALEHGKARVDADGEVCYCNLKRTYRTAGGDVVAVYRAGIRLGEPRPRLIDSIARAARNQWVAGHV